MLNLLSPAEAVAIAEQVCATINEQIPRFDVQQADADMAVRTKRGNCLAMVIRTCMQLEEMQVPYFFQQQEPLFFDTRKYHHAALIVPTNGEDEWGRGIDMVTKTPDGEHMQTYSYARRPVSPRPADMDSMDCGETLKFDHVVPGFGRCILRTATFIVGYAEYCRRTGLTNRGNIR